MMCIEGLIYFGFFDGLGYTDSTDKYEDFKKLKNDLSKEKIMRHIKENVDVAYTQGYCKDIQTGTDLPIERGIYEDGVFRFPTGFVYYLETTDIGIPYEYEEYIKTIL